MASRISPLDVLTKFLLVGEYWQLGINRRAHSIYIEGIVQPIACYLTKPELDSAHLAVIFPPTSTDQIRHSML